MHWATTSIKRGNRAGLCAGLVLTFLLGLTFLLTQMIEYHRIGFNTERHRVRVDVLRAHRPARLARLRRPDDPAGVMTVRAFRGHFSPEHHHGIEVGGIYWHFVDVMWIVVYVTVYIL